MVNGVPEQSHIPTLTNRPPPTPPPQPAAPSVVRCCHDNYRCLRNVVVNGLALAGLGLIGIGAIFTGRASVSDEPENPGLGITMLSVGAVALVPRLALTMQDMYVCCTENPRNNNFPDNEEQAPTEQELADYRAYIARTGAENNV